MLTRRTLVLGLAAALPITAATATPTTLSVTDARQAALDGDILLFAGDVNTISDLLENYN